MPCYDLRRRSFPNHGSSVEKARVLKPKLGSKEDLCRRKKGRI